MTKFIHKKNKANLAELAAGLIAKKINSLLKKQRYVVFGIPGGRSAKNVFKLLKNRRVDWSRVHFFMVDERFVSLTNKDSNFNLANKTFLNSLLKKNKLLRHNLHPFCMLNHIKVYSSELKTFSNNFDIVLLSAGEDGHVASLFPNHPSIKNTSKFFIDVAGAPKLPKSRMSASKNMLARSKFAVILFFDKDKKQALLNFKNRKLSVNQCPAKIVKKIKNAYVLTNIKL